MKILSCLMIIFFLLVSMSAWPKDQTDVSAVKDFSIDKNDKKIESEMCKNFIDVSVNGLVCDFCAQALKKVFSQREEIKGIDIDLNKGTVSIEIKKEETIDDVTLTQLIKKSGYSVEKIHRGC